MNKIITCITIIIVIILGIYLGIKVYGEFNKENNINIYDNKNEIGIKENIVIQSVEVSEMEEKTTPNTLIILKTYYTKCKHFVQEYNNIDKSLVNLTREEFKEKNKAWNVETFSKEEIVLSKELEKFCNQHYKLKLRDDTIVIYNINENGEEIEYEKTNITTEFLTKEDILKLKSGIIVYGRENLMSTIEDYE